VGRAPATAAGPRSGEPAAVRRLGWIALAAAAAGFLAAVPPARIAAAPAETVWRVSGTLTGTYDNDVSWFNCFDTKAGGQTHEHARLAARLAPVGTATFTRRGGLFARVRISVAGAWTLNGAYAPTTESPTGGPGPCASPVPIACAGPVVNPSPGRGADVVRLDLAVAGRNAVGFFREFVGMVESASIALPDPAKPFCSGSGEEPTVVVPLLGLSADDAVARAAHLPVVSRVPIRVPVARLSGHRAFTVALPPSVPDQCRQTSAYSTCRESGRFQMRLTFTPAR
jgi:hypothetical protein